jgi:Skp family chaperone for outer membrane proteins
MLRSTRATLTVGLCLVGVAGLVGRSFGQGPADSKVRPTGAAATSNNAAPAAAPAPLGPLSIGSIDMDSVLKNYDKFKVATETLRAEALTRHNDLMKIATEAKQQTEQLQRMGPGTPDAKKCEDKITQLKAQFEAGRENAEREFTQKEAETMATIYNEIQLYAKWVAKNKNMSFVVKYSEQAASGSEPNSVMAAMSRTILYADPRVDITRDVTYYLNEAYKASGGQPPKATAPAAATAPAPVGRPAPGGN